MAIATWDFAVTDMPTDLTAAQIIDYLDKPVGVRYIRRRNGYCELELDVNNEQDIHILEAAPYRRCILGYRNGIERFFGWVIESHETSDGYTIGCRDPYYALSWRRFLIDTTYTDLGDGEIAMRILEAQNLRQPTWLIRGDTDSGANRTRLFQQGDTAAEKIEYLSKLVGSFAFKIDALPYGTFSALAEMNQTTDFDTVQEKAIFAYGDGTFANCTDFERTCRSLVTGAWAAYTGGISYVDSVSGRATYGLWEDQRGQVTTTDETIAYGAAVAAVMDEPLYDLTIVPGPDAPQLFTDFDVFDAVPVILKRHGRTILGNKPVSRAVISLDPDSGNETLEEIVVLDEDAL
jgi:hypothetical protein